MNQLNATLQIANDNLRAHDCARAGLWEDAEELLSAAAPKEDGAAPLLAYTLTWVREKRGNRRA